MQRGRRGRQCAHGHGESKGVAQAGSRTQAPGEGTAGQRDGDSAVGRRCNERKKIERKTYHGSKGRCRHGEDTREGSRGR